MRKEQRSGVMLVTALLAAGISSAGLAVQERVEALSTPPVQAESAETLNAKQVIAHAQHEIILLHVKNDAFDKVWPAAQLLLSLQFPADLELKTVRSLAIIGEQLHEKGQYDLAQRILAAATQSLRDNGNRAKVFAIRARLYKLEGLDHKAIEAYQRAQELSRLP